MRYIGYSAVEKVSVAENAVGLVASMNIAILVVVIVEDIKIAEVLAVAGSLKGGIKTAVVLDKTVVIAQKGATPQGNRVLGVTAEGVEAIKLETALY